MNQLKYVLCNLLVLLQFVSFATHAADLTIDCEGLDVAGVHFTVSKYNIAVNCQLNKIQYQIQQFVGKGSHGTVFKALRRSDNTYVSIVHIYCVLLTKNAAR